MTILESRFYKSGGLAHFIVNSPVQVAQHGNFVKVFYGWTVDKKIMKKFIAFRELNGKSVFDVVTQRWDEEKFQEFINCKKYFEYEITMEQITTTDSESGFGKYKDIEVPMVRFESDYIVNGTSEIMSEKFQDYVDVPCILFKDKFANVLDDIELRDKSIIFYGAGCEEQPFYEDGGVALIDEIFYNESLQLSASGKRLNNIIDELELLSDIFQDTFYIHEV